MKSLCKLSLIVFIIVSVFSGMTSAGEDQKKSKVFDLGDVLVTEKSGNIGKTSTTNIISMDDIEQTGAATAAQALELIAGIDTANHPKTGPALKMRGFDQQTVKILIDGVPAHTAYDGYLDLGQIPVDAIAKIEVTKGASSVLYGANTMGGVINIITKKGGRDFYSKITTSFGRNNTENFILNHGGGVGKFNYWITCSSRKSRGYELSGDFDPLNPMSGIGTEYDEDGGIRDLSYYDKKTLNSKIGYDFDQDSKIYLSFDYHNNERGCPTFSGQHWAYDYWKQWQLNLAGQHDITEKILMKARVFYVNHKDALEDVRWKYNYMGRGKKWFQESFYDDYSLGGELQTYITLGENNLLKFGASYLKDHHTQQDYFDAACFPVIRGWASIGYQPTEVYEALTYSFGIEDEVVLLDDKLTLIAGAGYDLYKPKEANNQPVPGTIHSLNPQVGAVYQLFDSLSLHASVAKKTRFPQLKELYSSMAGGNPALEPQETIAYEFGMDKKINQALSFSWAMFYNDITNRITRARNAAGDKVYVNKGESTFKGFEVELDYETDSGLHIGADYTFISARDREDSHARSFDAGYIPVHKYTIDVRYLFDFGLLTSLQCIYTGRQYEYDNAGVKKRLNDFVLYNARLSQKLTLFKKITPELFFEVQNILDKNYEEGNGPAPGRSFLLGTSISF